MSDFTSVTREVYVTVSRPRNAGGEEAEVMNTCLSNGSEKRKGGELVPQKEGGERPVSNSMVRAMHRARRSTPC